MALTNLKSPAMSEGEFNGIFSGVDPTDGAYRELDPSEGLAKVLQLAEAEFDATSDDERQHIEVRSRKSSEKTWGFDPDVHLDDPRQAGWGVVFSSDESDPVREAIEPLIRHRTATFGIEPKVLEYSGEPVSQFLARYGVQQGIGQVAKVPYYLLIIGSPARIPFRFQYQLHSEYGVGRLDFADPAGYDAYVRQLIDYETAGAAPNRRQAVFWAPENRKANGLFDRATPLSAEHLAQALYDNLHDGFEKRIWRGEQDSRAANKANLLAELSVPKPPALLFTASHGLAYNQIHPDQPKLQGALLTQDGRIGRPVGREQCFSGGDVSAGLNVRGLIHYAFACFSAGTPARDDFSYGSDEIASEIAENPFVADLPRQMLARGALAFIGHVDRSWSYSFLGEWMSQQKDGATPMLAFQRAMDSILKGKPVGHVLRDQHDRALQLSNRLLEGIDLQREGIKISEVNLALQWIERNDARSYIVIGDPAACLRVEALEVGSPDRTVAFRGTAGRLNTGSVEPRAAASTAAETAASSPDIDGDQENPPDPSTAAGEPPVPFLALISSPESLFTTGKPEPAAPATGPKGTPVDPIERAGQKQGATSGQPPVEGAAAGRPRVIDPDIYEKWKAHITGGFEQNSAVFKGVLDAFMRPYWMTVTMYRVMFAVGILGFVAAAFLGVWKGIEFALVFGGLSVVAFLTYFVSRPLQALEQNILFITWLGVIYNTYWTRLMYANDETNMQRDLSDISRDTLNEIDRLVDQHARLSGRRLDLTASEKRPGADMKPAQ